VNDLPPRKLPVTTLFPLYCTGGAVSHATLALCEEMSGDRVEVRLFQPASDPAGRRSFTRDAIPPALKGLLYRLDRSTRQINRFCEFLFLRALGDGGLAYVWPGASLATYREVKRRGHPLAVERINCHTATARRILDEAYRRVGLPPGHGITDEKVRGEREELELADAVFAPSPLVKQFLLDEGVPAGKILSTSYGWSPQRLRGTTRALPPSDGITVLFVGLACIRKGAHLLLDAWARARLPGRLVIAGKIDPDIATLCADHLRRPDVVRLGHVADVGAVYRSADLFAFPSLEEGSPLVSYEAAACGLPLLVSPMGAGRFVRHGEEGFVIDPYDTEAWVAALHRLAADRDLRRAMGAAAARRAEEFTWRRVGQARADLLLERFAASPHPVTSRSPVAG
jgi:glycosyltransferase involved in cell wall biosynthesis